MAFESQGDTGSPSASINVTPLVDVVLVLLVVLMVAAAGAISEALPLDLPKASSGGQQPTLLRVAIAADGRLSIDGQELDAKANTEKASSLASVRAAASRALAADPEARAAIAADGEARHQRVIEVMDALRQGGIARLAIQVTPGAKR